MGKRWANTGSVIHLAETGYAARLSPTTSASTAGAAKSARTARVSAG